MNKSNYPIRLRPLSGGSFLLFIFLLSNILFAQRDPFHGRFAGQNRFSPVSFEVNIFPGDSLSSVFLSYIIPFDKMIFVKEGNSFLGGVTVDLEVFKDDKIAARQSKSDSLLINNYDRTKSSMDYFEGIIELKLSKGIYSVEPEFSIMHTDVSLKSDPFEIKIEEDYRQIILNPFILYSDKADCGNNDYYRLVNHNNSIPFSASDFSVLLQITDTSVTELNIKIIQDDETILENSYVTKNGDALIPHAYGNKIILTPLAGTIYRSVLISGFSNKLNEGKVNLIATSGTFKKEFSINVSWADKPRSLFMTEYAIRQLLIFEDPQVIDSLSKLFSDDYGKILFNYWKDKDPVKETAFNELMAEFYYRVDEANFKFQTTDNKLGAETDRGKIFIMFGEPDKIEREFPQKDAIVEIWNYSKSGRKFYFEDRTGLGNFVLIQNE